ANPTGDLHIGHGRGAVLGSCLANLFSFSGYDVEQEFLINDAGEQISKLAQCAWACYRRKLGVDVDYPEDGYPEDSINHYVDRIIEQHKDSLNETGEQESIEKIRDIIKELIRSEHQELLSRLQVNFDHWFSEKTLHESGKLDRAIDKLTESAYTYESEGALWLKAKDLGDERDRVLRKSSGAYTYLAGDAAYHLDKFERGYDLMINIWGADHHGQVPGLKAVVKALGQDADKLEVILTQIVNLNRDGKIVRMSKRRGTVVTLDEVMEEVGVDAVRYFLAESNPQNPINFDMELAKQTSRENPAFYIQYAHARCCSILRRAIEPYDNPESGVVEPPVITKSQLDEFQEKFKSDPSIFAPAFDEQEEVFIHQKTLVLKLQALPDEIEEAARTWQPGKLARYAYDVANDLQKFYEVSRVITSDLSVTCARLGLIMATRQVLSNVLSIIGVSAPERM
ncbi:MAG: arginine--tRNA ligase, partial [Candidatus Obscuribacterales bacterium]|nr:arginine--tRNA ligase [Candidatus Obscuribacterales bacterium]